MYCYRYIPFENVYFNFGGAYAPPFFAPFNAFPCLLTPRRFPVNTVNQAINRHLTDPCQSVIGGLIWQIEIDLHSQELDLFITFN